MVERHIQWVVQLSRHVITSKRLTCCLLRLLLSHWFRHRFLTFRFFHFLLKREAEVVDSVDLDTLSLCSDIDCACLSETPDNDLGRWTLDTKLFGRGVDRLSLFQDLTNEHSPSLSQERITVREMVAYFILRLDFWLSIFIIIENLVVARFIHNNLNYSLFLAAVVLKYSESMELSLFATCSSLNLFLGNFLLQVQVWILNCILVKKQQCYSPIHTTSSLSLLFDAFPT